MKKSNAVWSDGAGGFYVYAPPPLVRKIIRRLKLAESTLPTAYFDSHGKQVGLQLHLPNKYRAQVEELLSKEEV